MRFIKAAIGLGLVAAAIAAAAVEIIDELRKQKELDDFLLPEEDEPVVVDIPADAPEQATLEEDLKEFVTFDADKFPVVLTFGFNEADDVAEKSSTLAFENKVDDVSSSIDVTIDSIDENTLPEIQASLEEWVKASDAIYQGYHFAG